MSFLSYYLCDDRHLWWRRRTLGLKLFGLCYKTILSILSIYIYILNAAPSRATICTLHECTSINILSPYQDAVDSPPTVTLLMWVLDVFSGSRRYGVGFLPCSSHGWAGPLPPADVLYPAGAGSPEAAITAGLLQPSGIPAGYINHQ